MKNKTIYFCIFLLVALILVFFGLFASLGRHSSRDARIQADMAQTRTLAEIYYSEKNSYANFDCDSSEQTRIICGDIVAQGGVQPIFKSAINEYCGYAQDKERQYICVSRVGGMPATYIATYINPSGESFCDGKTFNCPDKAGMLSLSSPFFYEVLKEKLLGYLFPIFIVLSLVEVIFGIILAMRPGRINRIMGWILILVASLLFLLLFLSASSLSSARF